MRVILTALIIYVFAGCSEKKGFDAKIEFRLDKTNNCRHSWIINTTTDKIFTFTVLDTGPGFTKLVSLYPGQIKDLGCTQGREGFKIVGQIDGEMKPPPPLGRAKRH